MNASFENPAATNVCHLVSMPRFSSSCWVCRIWPISSWPDHTTIQPALSGHQPLLCSQAFDLGEICSYGVGQPHSVKLCPDCARAPLPSSRPPAAAAAVPRNWRRVKSPVCPGAPALSGSVVDELMVSPLLESILD